MSYLKDREIWLSKVPTGNPPAGFFWKFIRNGKVVVRDSSGNDQMMIATNGNQAITGSLIVTGGITGTISSASYVQYSNVANKPTLVSGSGQISFNGITNKPTLVSGSSQVTFLGLSSIPSGIVSGSAQVAQFGYATTGSNGFNGSQSITGSLTVTGQVVAQTLNVQQVTSSIVYSSGSNIFGNSLGNTQQFTGSVSITGSLNTSIAAFGSAATIFLTSDGGTIKSRTAAQTLSDIAALPLAGGTLTGALNGTSASFTGNVISTGGFFQFANNYGIEGRNVANSAYRSVLKLNASNQIEIGRDSDISAIILGTASANNALTISSTGAATFSSSVTATGGTEIPNGQFYRARRSSSNLLIDLLGIESGTDTTRLLITGDFNIKNGSLATLLNMTTTGAATITTTDNQGGLLVTSATDNTTIRVASTATNGQEWRLQSTGGTSGLGQGKLVFKVGTTETASYIPLTLTTDNSTNGGRVGIGTASPSAKLTIVKSTRSSTLGASSVLQISDAAAAGQAVGDRAEINFYTNSDSLPGNLQHATIGIIKTSATGNETADLYFGTSTIGGTPVERMRITSDGNIRYTSNNASEASFDLNYRFSTPDSARIRFSTTTSFNLNEPGELSFWTRANDAQGGGAITERMRITSAGDVLFNRTTLWTIFGDSGGAAILSDANGSALYATYDGAQSLALSRRGSDGSIALFRRATTTVGSISVTASATAFNTSSDYRLKEDLKEIKGLEKISALKVYNFKFKNSENRMDGVLAHELAEVLPYAVHGEKDGEEMQGVDYSKIVPILVKSIQEQQTLIESLKSRIEILEQ